MPELGDGRFDFIDDEILRDNLNQVFKDIIDLVFLMDDQTEAIQINLRRACILYTAAIIEALLHYLVEKKVEPLEYEADEWSYLGEPHKAYEYENDEGVKVQVICGKRFKKKNKITKGTQFKDMIRIALDNELINVDLSKEIDGVRKTRNNIHLATLTDIEHNYTKKTLDNIFDVARKVVEVVEAI